MKLFHFIEDYKIRRWVKGGLSLGKRVKIEKGCSIDPSFPWLVTIGNDVTIAPRVTILAHDASSQVHLGYTRLGEVRIGNRVFIGIGSIILPGVKIGDNVVIAAGSVVTRDIPSDSVVAGCPAKVIESIDAFKSKQQLKMTDAKKLDLSFTIAGGVTSQRKQEMQQMLSEGYVYIQ